MHLFRSRLLARCAAVALLAAAAMGAAQAQQAFPNRPLRILVPFAPGGSLDPVARLLAQKFHEAWGQPVVVDNRPGGNTIVATQALATSPPDGHTLLLTASTHVINHLLVPQLPYDSIKDFTPVATAIKSEFILVVHPSVPARNLQELLALARAQPDRIDYGSSGNGNGNHIAAELFNDVAGVKLRHIPYKGGGQVMHALVGGEVQVHFSVAFSSMPHIRSGKLRPLAHTGSTPPAELPDLPSFAAAGLPGFDTRSWQGILVPAGTPPAVVQKLADTIQRILAMPEVKDKLAASGQEVWFQGPAEFAALMRRDTESFGRIIRSANIRVD